jgi:hypothetical protein
VAAIVLGVAIPVWLLAVGDARDASIFLAAGACAALGAFARRTSRR